MIHPKHKGRYVQGPWPKYFSGVRRGYVLLTPCKTPIRLPMGCVEEGEYNQLLVMCELTGECEWMDERTLVDVPSRAAWEQQQEISSTNLDAKPGTWESAKAGTWDVSAWAGQLNPEPFSPLDKAEVVRVVSEAEQLTAARAEANDLMQRLTESQQEVAKLARDNKNLDGHAATLEEDNQVLERERDEAKQELAEVKAERDRLAGQVDKLSQENERQRKIYRQSVARNERLESRLKQIKALVGG